MAVTYFTAQSCVRPPETDQNVAFCCPLITGQYLSAKFHENTEIPRKWANSACRSAQNSAFYWKYRYSRSPVYAIATFKLPYTTTTEQWIVLTQAGKSSRLIAYLYFWCESSTIWAWWACHWQNSAVCRLVRLIHWLSINKRYNQSGAS